MSTRHCIRTTSILLLVSAAFAATAAFGATRAPEGTEKLPAEFWADLGDLYLQYRVMGEAEKAYAKALALATEPGEKAALHQRLARGYINAGNAEAALKSLDQAVELAKDPGRKRAYMMQRAELNGVIGDRNKALDDYEAIFSSDASAGEKSAARMQWLALHDQAGDLDAVVAGYVDRLGKNPTDLEALEMLEQVYTTHRPDQTKLAGVLEQLVALRPHDLHDLQRLAETYRNLERHEDAIDTLKELSRSAPRLQRAGYYSRIAEEYAAMGDSKHALEWADTLLRFGTDKHTTWAEVARLYKRIGEPDRAVAAYRRAVELAPTDLERQELEFELAELYAQKEQFEEAVTLFQALALNAEEPPLKKRAVERFMLLRQKLKAPIEGIDPNDPRFVTPE